MSKLKNHITETHTRTFDTPFHSSKRQAIWHKGQYTPITDFLRRHKLAAKLSEHVNFHCSFKNGECAHVRHLKSRRDISSDSMYKVGCCCGLCATYAGHLRLLRKQDLPKYEPYWNDDTGFFEPNKGCKLPRELRSATCLTHYCETAHKKMSKTDKVTLNAIKELAGR